MYAECYSVELLLGDKVDAHRKSVQEDLVSH